MADGGPVVVVVAAGAPVVDEGVKACEDEGEAEVVQPVARRAIAAPMKAARAHLRPVEHRVWGAEEEILLSRGPDLRPPSPLGRNFATHVPLPCASRSLLVADAWAMAMTQRDLDGGRPLGLKVTSPAQGHIWQAPPARPFADRATPHLIDRQVQRICQFVPGHQSRSP